jgi:membrane associated rhomboid family serine protease
MGAGTLLRALLGQNANCFAIVPRTSGGLLGIVTAPFVHGGLAHLLANLPPFVVLGALVLRHGEHTFIKVALLITFASGLLVWLLARSAAHMGASGVVFGFFGYLVAYAYFHHAVADVVIAVLVVLVYGSMLAGIKPARNGTSFEAHFFGLVAGIAVAWLDRAF